MLEEVIAVKGIYGVASIDGKKTRFLADTGSPRCFMNAKLLSTDQRKELQPVKFTVQTANGELAHIIGSK